MSSIAEVKAALARVSSAAGESVQSMTQAGDSIGDAASMLAAATEGGGHELPGQAAQLFRQAESSLSDALAAVQQALQAVEQYDAGL
ncbi:hypothetical protein [Rhizohabitans arisaemae]|uniref:hypothetical protein n=1 Tax=Rhizohabitans arisaemae TaxID=2720610 RepID=UPI0024B10A84|nr:hypothetical protein [Rhizohabitans arisaemae]